MDWFMAALVGAAGGVSIEAVDIVKAIKWHRQMPWNVQSDTIDPPRRRADVRPGEEHLPAPGWKAYCVAGVMRLLVSGALTGVVAATYPRSTNPLAAFLIGLGALSVVQQATTLVPLMVKSAGRAALGASAERRPDNRLAPGRRMVACRDLGRVVLQQGIPSQIQVLPHSRIRRAEGVQRDDCCRVLGWPCPGCIFTSFPGLPASPADRQPVVWPWRDFSGRSSPGGHGRAESG